MDIGCIMIVTPAQTEIDVKTSIKEKAERN
jgi:hypothetical protein